MGDFPAGPSNDGHFLPCRLPKDSIGEEEEVFKAWMGSAH